MRDNCICGFIYMGLCSVFLSMCSFIFRKCSSEACELEERTVIMQASSGHTHQTGNSDGLPCLSLPTNRSPADGSTSSGDVAINIHSANSESGTRSAPRHARPTIRFQNRPGHTHSHTNGAGGQDDSNNTDTREHGNSISEVLHVYQWLDKSFPYILIFSAKLMVQHLTGTTHFHSHCGYYYSA